MKNSLISWTHHTFNPWIGCSEVNEGCAHCYARASMELRWHRVRWGLKGDRIKTSPDYWRQPVRWDREAQEAGQRRLVFCASLADVFEPWQEEILDSQGRRLWEDMNGSFWAEGQKDFPLCLAAITPVTMDGLRRNLFELIDRTPHLTWLLLTKRPENILQMWPRRLPRGLTLTESELAQTAGDTFHRPNVWLGTSPCSQETADGLIPDLLKCRGLGLGLFLSCEPLLGPIDLVDHFANVRQGQFLGRIRPGTADPAWPSEIGWVIIGGESGRQARPCDLTWIADLVGQCHRARVPCFVKQLGSAPYLDHSPPAAAKIAAKHGVGPLVAEFFHLRDPKGGDPVEWPEELRVRHLPEVGDQWKS
jgi:protein gp37